jgi:hypothetical protein
MLVKKGGISRNIDEKNLASYKAKGFAPVEVTPKKDDGKAGKTPGKE